jgi:hypothetical protein
MGNMEEKEGVSHAQASRAGADAQLTSLKPPFSAEILRGDPGEDCGFIKLLFI